jgi:hypothetical protein
LFARAVRKVLSGAGRRGWLVLYVAGIGGELSPIAAEREAAAKRLRIPIPLILAQNEIGFMLFLFDRYGHKMKSVHVLLPDNIVVENR